MTITDKDLRLWLLERGVAKDIGAVDVSKQRAEMYLSRNLLDSLATQFPDTYLSYVGKFREALQHQGYYSVQGNHLAVVGFIIDDNEICPIEFIGEFEGGNCLIEEVNIGYPNIESRAWKSIKSENRNLYATRKS